MRTGWLVAALVLGLVGCGSGVAPSGKVPPSATSEPSKGSPPPTETPSDPPSDPQSSSPPPTPTPPPPAPVFEAGFHQALRWSTDFSDATTIRMKLPVARAGARVRVTFRSGDGAMQLLHASVANVGSDGSAEGLVPLTFAGAAGASVPTRTLITSDPVEFGVSFDEELYVSFAVTGSVAQSAIIAFPGSVAVSGDHALDAVLAQPTSYGQATGVATVEVEGPPSPLFVAIGDSITEGYSSGNDDYRVGWTHVLESKLGLPVANAGVSGQGVNDALAGLAQEVFPLQHVTDCTLLIGTNDLWDMDASQLESKLTQIDQQLAPFCRVWVGTLLPKERDSANAATMEQRREALNAWIRSGDTPFAGVIDFEAAVSAPGDPTKFAPGMDEDGIHPTAAGYAAMAQAAYDYLSAHALP